MHGRENQFKDKTIEIINNFLVNLLPIATPDGPPRAEGKSFSVMLIPKRIDKKPKQKLNIGQSSMSTISIELPPLIPPLDMPVNTVEIDNVVH
jgi:hypothetical protein